MANIFIKPEELDNDRLLYWAKHHAQRYIQVQKLLNTVEAQHQAFLVEVMDRGLLEELMESLTDG